MLKKSFLLFVCLTVFSLRSHLVEFEWPKTKSWSLTASFCQKLQTWFQADFFIETGTFMGETTDNFRKFFSEVHTIELKEDFYERALGIFGNAKNVFLYHGQAEDILPSILDQLNNKGKILLWLDAHYSGGTTALGNIADPILEELEIIKRSGIANAVILIDDLRSYGYRGHITLKKILSSLKEINEDYQFYCYGDIGLAFLKTENIVVSHFIKAMTDWKFGNVEERIKAKKFISNAKGNEKESFNYMCSLLPGYDDLLN